MKLFPNPTAASLSTDCRCGCGEETSSYRSAYRPGHDSNHIPKLMIKMIGYAQELGDGVITAEQAQDRVNEAFRALPSAALQDRLYGAVTRYGQGRLMTQFAESKIQPFADDDQEPS